MSAPVARKNRRSFQKRLGVSYVGKSLRLASMTGQIEATLAGGVIST